MSELSIIDINNVNYSFKDNAARNLYLTLNGVIEQEQATRIATCVVGCNYNSQQKTIELLNANDEVVGTIDATLFIKDGMVSDVAVVNGYLVITFNTDSGKSPISIPLTSIFNPSNYYQKSEIDSKLAEKQSEISNLESKIGYYECSSGASRVSKTVTASNYVLGNGGSIKIKMQYANTANDATLNINSTGAKALYYDGARASSTNTWEEGEVLDVYYDGTNFQANNSAGGGKFASGEKVREVGIDSQPTAGSDNLVKSEGIWKQTGDLSNCKLHNSWLLGTGKYSKSDNYRSTLIPIKAGDIIIVSKATETSSYIAFMKSNENIDKNGGNAPLCDNEGRRVISGNDESYTAPSDVNYLYVGLSNPNDATPQKLFINGYDILKSLKENIVALQENIVALQEDLNETRDLIYPELKFPTNTWDSKNFTSNTGTDGIFFDKRNKITSGRTLEKIGVKTRYAGKVKIHYLSTIPPFAEIANEVHDVLVGINEFSPIAELDYSQDFYVAFSNVSDDPGGVMLVYPTDNTGQGTKITFATGQATDNTYAYALWIKVTENRFDKLENEIEELSTNGINTLEGLKKAIADNIGLIRLDGVEFTLDGPLFIPSGTKLTGVRGKTVINVPSTVLKGIELNNVEDVTIENITLVGAYNGTPIKTGLQPVKPGVADTADDIRQFVNAGYQTDMENGGVDTSNYIPQLGINIKSSEKIEIIGCEIKNFSYYGIANALSGKNYRYACKFENNYINNCYCGIYLYNEAERSQYIANNVSLCQVGLYLDSGTNMFTDCAFSANRVGMFMGNGWNHAHGVQTGNAFTHCSLFSIYAYNVGVGEVFSQCKFGYIDNEDGNSDRAIYIKNSRGLSFNNCQMIQCNIAFDGKFYLLGSSYSAGEEDVFGNKPYNVTYTDITGQASQYNGGINQLLGCCFISGGGSIIKSEDLDNTNVIMKNNFFTSGQDSSGVNN